MPASPRSVLRTIRQYSRRSLGLQFHRAPTDNDRGGYVGQWDVTGLLGPALGPFDSRSGWERRAVDGAIVVTTEFTLRPHTPKPRLCQLFYKVGVQHVRQMRGKKERGNKGGGRAGGGRAHVGGIKIATDFPLERDLVVFFGRRG